MFGKLFVSEKALAKLQIVIIVVVICIPVIGLSAWWITMHEPTPFWLGENVAEKSIKIEAEGEILHYQENRVWSENYFLDIIKNQDEFEHALIENFNQALATYGEYNEQAVDCNVEFYENRNMTVLRCDNIKGAKSGNWFTFKWLLRPLGYPEFDFYDFQESENGLSWEGTIDNVQTSITISFPFTINHCKAHVWPE